MRKFLLTLAVLCGTVSGWAQTSLRISDGLLATQVTGTTQYEWTSAKLTAPEGDFNKLRITFLKNSTGRMPAGFPFVCIAEFYLYDKAGKQVTLNVANFSSNATQSGEGKMEAICDNITSGASDNYDWYWHSQWSGTPDPYGYHYLEINVADIEADLSEYKIGWITRQHDGSPADVIISTGATTAEAAKNANSHLLPKVSTDRVKLYTIKSVRTKKYLSYSEENAKPQQNAATSNESYWYFTQGTGGNFVVHNAVSGKVLGTNFEMSTEGEWYVSPANYRPGVVFSKTADISTNNCIDDQGGSIGSWSHTEGDNEGTTWLVEEAPLAPVDIPVFSLNNMKISSIGNAVTEIVVDKWYILNNVGRGNYVSQEGNNWKMRATNSVAQGNMAKAKAGYLFKITKNGEYYNIMSGNGKYFQLGRNTASTSDTPVNFEISLISNSDNNFCIFDKDHGYAADGQETDNAFVGWANSVPANAGGNDSYRILPVELFDLGVIGALKTELSEAIIVAQNKYNSVENYIGEGVGKYSAPADFETQLATINTFCNGIDENTDLNDINAKKAELEALIASVQLNMPIAGKFYRMHNDEKYITSGVTDAGRIALSETNNDAASVYYYDGTHLLAYGTGLYMGLNASDWTFEAVGSTDISAIQFVAAVNGAVAKYNIKSADRWLHRTDAFVNRCTNNTCGDAHNWTIEEVTWLPVPVNEDLGYATLYSPVQLELSYGRFKAYAANLNADGTALTLTKLDAVPANTAVILELQEGATVENGCSYLQIQESTLSSVETQLQGTLSDSYVDGDAYILAKPEGYATGFYKAAKNYENGTKFLNNGFKAYLPAPVSGARFYVFDFGTETAIENIEGAESANDAVIYDLAGRRVQNAQKGLYIVNGKKVIK